MFSPRASETNGSRPRAHNQSGIKAWIDGVCLQLLLLSIVVALLLAGIAYLVKIELEEFGWRLRRELAMGTDRHDLLPFKEHRMLSKQTTPNRVESKWSRFRPGIFGRVYAFSLLLAGLAVAACIVVGQYLIERNLKDQVHSLARWMVEEGFDADDKAVRNTVLRRLYERGRVRMTLYDAGGVFLGSAGPAFPLPSAELLAELRRTGEEGFTGEEAKLSVAHYQNGVFKGYGFVAPAAPFSIFFDWPHALLVLGTIALIAWPLAVSLTGPVRALSETMNVFGAGDLSARVAKLGNDEIGELALGFNRLAARIQDLLQSEKMLLAAVSHELRTPLQRVRLALDLAADAEGPNSQTHLAGVSADLNDLDELLSDILVVARLDPARPASERLLSKQSIPPDELIAECVERIEAAHPERTFLWPESPRLPLCEMDPRFVRRALLNLLENAARYSPPNEPIEIASWADQDELFIEVRDKGPGIPAELQSRIFEPFFQGDAARSDSSGSGLGLSIVQRIAEAHGGRVGVSGCGGATFRIALPLAGTAHAKPGRVAPQPPG
jgi:two-component system, OmpR family, sensor kinase